MIWDDIALEARDQLEAELDMHNRLLPEDEKMTLEEYLEHK